MLGPVVREAALPALWEVVQRLTEWRDKLGAGKQQQEQQQGRQQQKGAAGADASKGEVGSAGRGP